MAEAGVEAGSLDEMESVKSFITKRAGQAEFISKTQFYFFSFGATLLYLVLLGATWCFLRYLVLFEYISFFVSYFFFGVPKWAQMSDDN